MPALVSWCLCVFVVTLFGKTAGIGVLADFEGGSIGKVERVSPTHLRCAVKGQSDQDHRNRQANWYYFEILVDGKTSAYWVLFHHLSLLGALGEG